MPGLGQHVSKAVTDRYRFDRGGMASLFLARDPLHGAQTEMPDLPDGVSVLRLSVQP